MSDYPTYPSSGPEQPMQPQRGPKPAAVDTAVKLIWASIALSVVGTLLTFLYLDTMVDQVLESSAGDMTESTAKAGVIVGAVVGLVISVGLYALLAVFIGKGANWARITFTVLAAIGILFGLLNLLGGSQPALLMVVGLISLVLGIGAIVLLWKKESSAWFTGAA